MTREEYLLGHNDNYDAWFDEQMEKRMIPCEVCGRNFLPDDGETICEKCEENEESEAQSA